jgi:hypothetical protein
MLTVKKTRCSGDIQDGRQDGRQNWSKFEKVTYQLNDTIKA